MQISLLLMQQIAQLFLILLMGYAVVKTGLLKASNSKVLSVVFVYLVMPCVVLNAFQIKDTPEIRFICTRARQQASPLECTLYFCF